MVPYWIKTASNTFENTDWLKWIYLVRVFMVNIMKQTEFRKPRELGKRLNATVKEVRDTFEIEKCHEEQ